MRLTGENINNIQEIMNKKAANLLGIVKQEYGDCLDKPEQKNVINEMDISNYVKIDPEFQEYYNNEKTAIENDSSLSPVEKIEKINSITPDKTVAKGQDKENNSITLYTSKIDNVEDLTMEQVIEKLEEILIREILYKLIKPEMGKYRETYGLTEFTTETLVDTFSRKLMEKYGIKQSFSESYAKNVDFMKEALANVGDEKAQAFLAFNGSIDEIYKSTTTPEFNSIEKANNTLQFDNDKDRMLDYTGDVLGTKAGIVNYEVNSGVNEENKEELEDDEELTNEELSEEQLTTLSQQEMGSMENNEITPYYQVYFNEKAEERNINKDNTYKMHNNELAVDMQKKHMLNKSKVKKLELVKPDNNNGYASNLFLYLLVSFVSGMIITFIYVTFR